ncbi:uncharacterized protein LOC108468203 isoform X4 [Gossypium arboreum]|uniref:uncharacterized protein LOC108468203 isoform X4 n=1 Tax=Gossypium arboreum TaxID=29729 RepID=UPI000818FF88|nr:uncharacterized protein LOC108468203 isoform X4 [Gossypium arboreum]XP_017624582.1 uncharacterized protein LOC108468203 isoform X4 [Gossypium arboreum]XP_017624583.1 uncharacterized protein LOC108468203 isoform X4 [Gossypium arboreum]
MQYVKPLHLFQNLVKSNASQGGRLLGLDVGDKYVGLAISDLDNKIASPLSVLVRKKTNIDLVAHDFQSLDAWGGMWWRRDKGPSFKYFCGIWIMLFDGRMSLCLFFSPYHFMELGLQMWTCISELSLVGFVVGYPFDRQRLAPDATQVKLFIDDLSETGKLDGLKFTFWDERFTSKNVELLIKPLSLHPVLAKTVVDKFAAVQILQAYLDYVNKKENRGCNILEMILFGFRI